jgi:hypothetical protein
VISRSVVLAGLLSSKNISLPNGMVFRWFEESSDPIGSARRREGSYGLELATGRATGEEIWRKKSAPDSPSTPHEEDASKLRRVLDQRELTEILSL